MRRQHFGFFCFLIFTFTLGAIDSNEPLKCYGHSELCDRKYNEVAFMSSHNSMSNRAAGWVPPDNLYGLTQQMEDGVRGLVIDIHPYKHSLYLCHSYCEFGRQHLFDGFIEIKQFLGSNPTEILALFIETYASNRDLAEMIIEAGLEPFTYTHDFILGWPTLREMVEKNTRLIVMVDRGFTYNTPQWLYKDRELAHLTPWDVIEPEDFICTGQYPNFSSDKLYLINHFLLAPFTMETQSERVNFNPLLRNRAFQCWNETGHIPNFISPTFYSVGDLKSVIDELNGVGDFSLRRGR